MHLKMAIFIINSYCLNVKTGFLTVAASVADPVCLSRIQKRQQKRGVKKNLLSYLFSSYKFHKIENYLIFYLLKKKIWANFQRNIALFTQKFVPKLSKR
jgi:hypothetical protein